MLTSLSWAKEECNLSKKKGADWPVPTTTVLASNALAVFKLNSLEDLTKTLKKSLVWKLRSIFAQ